MVVSHFRTWHDLSHRLIRYYLSNVRFWHEAIVG
nr:MAG TPA: hypothetical protein [Caudoviricetes sp.]